MAMLSRDDMVMILEYVIQYNDGMLFSTTPERIRYQYEETRQESRVTYKRVEEPEPSESPQKENRPQKVHSETLLYKPRMRHISLEAFPALFPGEYTWPRCNNTRQNPPTSCHCCGWRNPPIYLRSF
mgnify:CR=1 FL=1